jgi:molybdopterin-guanine dinucleotide biosynthesis protein A
MVAVSQIAPMPTKNPRVVVYLTPELKAALEALAEKRNRSVSNLLETLAKNEVESAKERGELPRD